MEIKEIIEILECAKAEKEWNAPLNYAIAFEEAIKILKSHVQDVEEACKNCTHLKGLWWWEKEEKKYGYCCDMLDTVVVKIDDPDNDRCEGFEY